MPDARSVLDSPLPLLLALTLAACSPSADDAGSQATASEGPLFAESVEEDECAVLTVDDVAAIAGIEASAIEQQAIAGICLHEWDAGTLTVMDIDVHESREEARDVYDRYTADVTAQQMDSARGQIDEELDEQAAEGEMSERDRDVASTLMDAMEVGDVRHERFDVGDGASLSTEGSLRVLYGNVVVWITGKTGTEDSIEPGVAEAAARRVVENLDGMR